MIIFYSATTNGFYSSELKKSYDVSGSWPIDAVKLSDEEMTIYRAEPPEGKMLGSDGDGRPAWVSIPELSNNEKIARYRSAVGAHIDQQAQTLGFDSIVTAVTYADEPADPLNQSYGQALRAWRSQCWEKCREVLVTWQGGGAEPTVDELIASLPAFVAP